MCAVPREELLVSVCVCVVIQEWLVRVVASGSPPQLGLHWHAVLVAVHLDTVWEIQRKFPLMWLSTGLYDKNIRLMGLNRQSLAFLDTDDIHRRVRSFHLSQP